MATDRRTLAARRAAAPGARVALLVVALLLVNAAWLTVLASPPLPAARLSPTVAAAGQDHVPQQPAAQEHASAAARPEETAHGGAHEEPLWKTGARLFNFAILVGVLVYFLRKPIADYLARRSGEIRGGLITAAQTQQSAAQELARVEQRLAALPGDIEALKARGAAEIAAEEARIRQTAEAERARLLEQARREIDQRVRVAERELVRHAAELSVELASERIKRHITDEDRERLVERYLTQLGK